jgi:hypothetical protein
MLQVQFHNHEAHLFNRGVHRQYLIQEPIAGLCARGRLAPLDDVSDALLADPQLTRDCCLSLALAEHLSHTLGQGLATFRIVRHLIEHALDTPHLSLYAAQPSLCLIDQVSICRGILRYVGPWNRAQLLP